MRRAPIRPDGLIEGSPLAQMADDAGRQRQQLHDLRQQLAQHLRVARWAGRLQGLALGGVVGACTGATLAVMAISAGAALGWWQC